MENNSDAMGLLEYALGEIVRINQKNQTERSLGAIMAVEQIQSIMPQIKQAVELEKVMLIRESIKRDLPKI